MLEKLQHYVERTDTKRILNSLRDQLDQSKTKTLAIISPRQGDGKTFFCCAMGYGFSHLMKKKVLILNAAENRQARSLSYTSVFLVDKKGAVGTNAPVLLFGGLAYLHMEVFCAHHGANEYSLAAKLEDYHSSYDYILIDTCGVQIPQAGPWDPLIIAGQAGCSLVVLNKKSLKPYIIDPLNQLLTEAKTTILGVVSNEGINI